MLRDSSSAVLFGFSTPFGELTCIQAEIKSLLFGVQQCLLRKFSRIQVEVDSLVLINILLNIEVPVVNSVGARCVSGNPGFGMDSGALLS